MYLNLKKEMDRENVTIEKISELLKIHRNSVSSKINGDGSFSIEESISIRDKFFPYATLEYLYKKTKKSADVA